MERLKKQLRFRAVFLFHLPSLPGNRILGAPRGAARRSADPARRSSRSSTPWTRRRRRPRPCRTSDRARVHMDSSCLDAMRVGTHGQDAKERSRNMERFEPFTLGQCPFCNGGATAAVRRFDERTIGMWYVAFDYDLRPRVPERVPIRPVRHDTPVLRRMDRRLRLRPDAGVPQGVGARCPHVPHAPRLSAVRTARTAAHRLRFRHGLPVARTVGGAGTPRRAGVHHVPRRGVEPSRGRKGRPMKSVIPLGECPFCGGGVTVGVDEYDSETGMVYFSYGDRPRCENGCPRGTVR